MPAARTRAAGVVRRHHDKPAAVPRHLATQLSAELGPALVENGAVEAGFGPDAMSGLFRGAFAERDMFLTCRSSMQTTAWLLLIVVEVLCR